jgi:hypothetical protein
MNRQTKWTPLGGEPEKPPLKHTPFPGLIDDHKWLVKEGRWPVFIDRSDLEGEGGVMHVPLDGTPVGRKLRLHEQAHVRWTPNVDAASIGGVQAATIEACEDGRIIELMNRQNQAWRVVNSAANVLPDRLRTKHERDFEVLAAKLRGDFEDPNSGLQHASMNSISLLQAARLVAMSRGYYEAELFDSIANAHGLGWIPQAIDDMHQSFIGSKESPTFEDTIAYARELERFFHEMEEKIVDQNEELMEIEMPHMRTPDLVDEENAWGPMTIENAPLTQMLRGDPTRKPRSADTGAVPRHMHRLPIDQRIFGRRRKQQRFQGTLLIDLSGSMSLSFEEVEEILTRWPAVTIATYSGFDDRGILRIVAKNGRRASTKWLNPPAGSNNMVDGPALDWLAKQKSPRVWISDGGVTGLGGHSVDLVRDAAKKCSQAKIKRIEDVRSLLG